MGKKKRVAAIMMMFLFAVVLFWKPNDVSAGIVAVRVDVLSQKKHFFVPVVAHASHRIHQNEDRYRPCTCCCSRA